jgi:hypothetical protein
MDFAKGGLLIVAGLFVLWVAVTGRAQKLLDALGVIRSAPDTGSGSNPNPPNQVFTHVDTGRPTGTGYNVFQPSATGVVAPMSNTYLNGGPDLALLGGVPPMEELSWYKSIFTPSAVN